MSKPALQIEQFDALQDYTPTFEAMKKFSAERQADDADQLWLMQHHDVLTQGQAGKPEHILMTSDDLPIVQTDRGGQVTWHGKGQLMIYLLFDLNRLKWHVRDLVDFGELLLIDVLADYGLEAYTKKEAPGVYIHQRKIGSLGFKIRRGCSYHGLSLNIDCDLYGFQRINPCGFAGLQMVRLSDLLSEPPDFEALCQKIIQYMQQKDIFSSITVGQR
jgi:lipoyl(octanoyl) transferase